MKITSDLPSSGDQPATILNPVVLRCGKKTLHILDHTFRVSPRGMTFKTDSYFDPFTSLRIRLHMPPTIASPNGRTIECEGAVVECRGDHKRSIYYVTVAFLNLTSADQKHLHLAHRALPKGLPVWSHRPHGGASSQV